MDDNNIKKAFSSFKNTLYDSSYSKQKLTDIAELITKENKTKQEYQKINNLLIYIDAMVESLQDIGTKIAEINTSEEIEFDGFKNFNKNETHIKDIVLYMDQFIDALFAFMRTHSNDSSSFELKKSSTYLKAIRDSFVKSSREFKLKIIRNPHEEKNFRVVINDAIDNFIKEGYSFRILVLRDKLQKAIEEYDRKHRHNEDRE